MNLQLDDLDLFCRVAALGSFSAAARERDTPVSQVSRAIARLEATCGARLMHRTTHALSLTDEGDALRAQALRMLDIQAELQADLGGKRAGPSGWVRLSVSTVLAQAIVAPALPALYDKHPGLHVDLSADDRIVDMAREGVDLAFRTGTPHSDTVVAREIGRFSRGLYAAPAYLSRHGMPRRLDDLSRHRLVTNSAAITLNDWPLAGGRAQRHYTASGHTRVDNTAALVALVQCGAGIGRIVDLVARPLVASGALVPVLPGALAPEQVPMYAVTLRERHRLPKVRACIEHWAEWLASDR
jgi:DNA-binding transcriptional LysR family regulator